MILCLLIFKLLNSSHPKTAHATDLRSLHLSCCQGIVCPPRSNRGREGLKKLNSQTKTLNTEGRLYFCKTELRDTQTSESKSEGFPSANLSRVNTSKLLPAGAFLVTCSFLFWAKQRSERAMWWLWQVPHLVTAAPRNMAGSEERAHK